MFQAHNETMNVWTHLLGGLLFVAFTVHVLVDAYTSGVAATAGPTETPCDASLFVSSSPYLANGSHTAAMYQAAIATNLKHADSAFEWRELARGLSDKVTQAQQAVSDGETCNRAFRSTLFSCTMFIVNV